MDKLAVREEFERQCGQWTSALDAIPAQATRRRWFRDEGSRRSASPAPMAWDGVSAPTAWSWNPEPYQHDVRRSPSSMTCGAAEAPPLAPVGSEGVAAHRTPGAISIPAGSNGASRCSVCHQESVHRSVDEPGVARQDG